MDTYMFEKIYDIFSIPIYVVKDGAAVYQIPDAEKQHSPLECDKILEDEIISAARMHSAPFIYLENEMIYYGIFRTEDDFVCVFGPMARKTMETKVVEIYRHSHRMKQKIAIAKYGLGIASKILAMASYHFNGVQIHHQDVKIESKSDMVTNWNQENDIERYQLEQSEEERTHNSSAYENRMLQIVRNGDVAAMKELMSEDVLDMDKVGVVAVDNLKQTEYLMVSFITLISRAAIDGGLNPERSFELGDIYLQQIEKCKTATEISMVGLKAQFEFTELVQDAKKQRSSLNYVEECKDYIGKHLRKPLKVGDIAPAIGVNRTYLARKFSEAEGITIQQYIMQERCKHAANLLKYSDYPISIISEYFCFSSQSHFGIQFKKMFGMTPNEYRNLNRYIESAGIIKG